MDPRLKRRADRRGLTLTTRCRNLRAVGGLWRAFCQPLRSQFRDVGNCMSKQRSQLETGVGALNVTAPPQRPTPVRLWLLTILSFTVLVAYLDRVNASVLIAFPPSCKKWDPRNLSDKVC